MIRSILFALLLMTVAFFPASGKPAQANPVANPDAVVTEGQARFTVLTPRLVRMEWSEDGRFEDRASLAVLNRRLDVPRFTVIREGKTLIIETDSLTLRYTGRDPFSDSNLSVSFRLNGKYEGMDPRRRLTVTFEGVYPPEDVLLNGKKVPYTRLHKDGNRAEWTYDGADLAWTLFIPETKASATVTVRCRYPEATAGKEFLLRGKKGRMRRIREFTDETKRVYCQYDDPFQVQPKAFLDISQCASFITEDPVHTEVFLKAFDLGAMIESIQANDRLPDWFKKRTEAIGTLY